METLIYLPSVGTFINPDSLITYACHQDNTPDLGSAVHLKRVHNNWIAALSRTDFLTIIEL